MRGRRGSSLVEVLTALFMAGVFLMILYLVFQINHEAAENYIVRADLGQEMDRIVDQVVTRGRGARAAVTMNTADEKTVTFELPGGGTLQFQITGPGRMTVADAAGREILSERVVFSESGFVVAGKRLVINLVLADNAMRRRVSLSSSTEIFLRNF